MLYFGIRPFFFPCYFHDFNLTSGYMDKVMIPKHQLEDFPELIHCIQSLLPIEEAARTSILSKSWLYAWSTNPTLRFSDAIMLFSKQPERRFRKLIDNTLLKDLRNNIQSDRSSEGARIFSKQPQNKYRKYISRTLRRYIRDNIPIESFNLEIYIQDKQGASHTNKWIREVASKSCVKELYLTIGVKIPSLTLPDEIFSGANLNTISVRASGCIINPLLLSSNVVINCVSLRVLELIEVHMSEDVLNNLLSTCFMLEKINLCCEGVKTIKVKNLKSLRELKIASLERNNNLEIGDVPSLDSLFYYSCRLKESLPFNADSLGNLKELCLGGVIKDKIFFDMIKSNLPFLETLTLQMGILESSCLDITCYSLKRLTLICQTQKTDIKVFAPKLLFFYYIGKEIPSLVFPAIPPEQIRLRLTLIEPLDHLFLQEMREALNLSSKFDIEILDKSSCLLVPLDIDLDDLRRRLPIPAMNVKQLSFSTCSHERLWGESPLFETFFLVCHPTYVKTNQNMAFRNKKYFRKLMVKRKIKLGYLSDVKDLKIRNPVKGNWETLKTYWKSFPDESAYYDWDYVEFQLTWCSP